MIKEEFISEAIKPATDMLDTNRMAGGEPGIPLEFTWRGKNIRVLDVKQCWKETGPCRHGSGERYVRKHWFEVVTESDGIMKIYFERQPKGRRKSGRWRLFTVSRE
ncbi:MAG: DUF6504 family protein [Desulfobacterales bacterium]|jgi:phosphoribosylglycinamide formyltransferase-1|nr:DUF6504 family protein [Desulfobacterales bacterium]